MEDKMTLVILAAGMGSRYGGLKQIDPITKTGEFIIDFSVYDAIVSGFDKVVFVIKKENLEVFRDTIGKRFESKVKVEYAFQELTDLPEGFSVPEGRVKPWGTAHALLCAKHLINDPFMVMEQPWLVKRFDQVMMTAHQGADWLKGDTTAAHQPQKPLLCGLRGFCRAVFSKDVYVEWKRLRKDGCFSPVNALKVLLFAARGQQMFLAADALMPKEWQGDQTELYSCWMSFDAYAAALMKRMPSP